VLAWRRLGEDVTLQAVDLRDPLPFGDEAFDDVVASLVLHLPGGLGPTLAELRRVLKPAATATAYPTHGGSWAAMVATTMTTTMVLDSIEQVIWTRRCTGILNLNYVVHQTDRGSHGGFNRSLQHRVVILSVVGRQRLPPVFSTRVFCGVDC
jgi:SAM-dependent methyltransferase